MSWYSGKLASMSFMVSIDTASFLFVLRKDGEQNVSIKNLPLEASVLLHKVIKVSHQLVDSFSHVHVSNGCPNSVIIGKRYGGIFGHSFFVLVFIPANQSQSVARVARGWTYMYFCPSSIGSRSCAMAWYVNSCINGARVSMDRSVMMSVPLERPGVAFFGHIYPSTSVTKAIRCRKPTGKSLFAF